MGLDRGAAVLLTALLVGAAARLPVLEDEAYYWTWSRSLAVHYYDHPPAVAWLIRGFQVLTGDRWLALRVLSLTCMAVTATMVAATARRLVMHWAVPTRAGTRSSDGSPAPVSSADALAVWGLAGSLLFTVALIPCTPDAPLAACLALSGYSMTRALTLAPQDGLHPSTSSRWTVVTGLALTAAILCKLSAALMAVGLAVGAASTPSGRRWLRSALGLSAAAGVVGVVGAWGIASSGIPSALVFQVDRVFGGSSRWIWAVPLTAGGVMLVVGPALTLGGIAASRRARDPASVALLGGVAALLAGCVVAVGLGSGELNWLLPAAIWGAPVVGAVAAGARWGHRYRRVAQVQVFVVAGVLIHIIRPVWPVAPERDRTLRSAGWAEVAAAVDARASAVGADLLVADGYQRASQLRFHLDDRWLVHEWGRRRVSQYDRWPKPPLCRGQTVLVVGPLGGSVGDRSVLMAKGETQTAVRARAGRLVERIDLSVMEVVVGDSGACSGFDGPYEGRPGGQR